MTLSAVLCRAQEAHYREKAVNAPLDNVRAVARQAELAWGQEAAAAETREERHRRARVAADAPETLEQSG